MVLELTSTWSLPNRSLLIGVYVFFALVMALFAPAVFIPFIVLYSDFLFRGPLTRSRDWVRRRRFERTSVPRSTILDEPPPRRTPEERKAAREKYLAETRADHDRTVRRISLVLLLVLALGALAFVVDPRPWMPTERVTFQDGTSQVGYVVSGGPDEFALLTQDRRIELREADQVQSRALCSMTPGVPTRDWHSSLLELLYPTPDYPDCHG
jgi:hypothetical protein